MLGHVCIGTARYDRANALRAAADVRSKDKLNYHKEIASEYFVRFVRYKSRWEGVDSFSNIAASRTGDLGIGNFKNGDFSFDF